MSKRKRLIPRAGLAALKAIRVFIA
jgi:hypothetical protein